MMARQAQDTRFRPHMKVVVLSGKYAGVEGRVLAVQKRMGVCKVDLTSEPEEKWFSLEELDSVSLYTDEAEALRQRIESLEQRLSKLEDKK